MASFTEKLGDFYYEVASRVTSLRTGLPTKVEVEILKGAIVDGVFRNDPSIRPGWVATEAMRTGKTVYVQDYDAVKIRRKIVFIENPTSNS